MTNVPNYVNIYDPVLKYYLSLDPLVAFGALFCFGLISQRLVFSSVDVMVHVFNSLPVFFLVFDI